MVTIIAICQSKRSSKHISGHAKVSKCKSPLHMPTHHRSNANIKGWLLQSPSLLPIIPTGQIEGHLRRNVARKILPLILEEI